MSKLEARTQVLAADVAGLPVRYATLSVRERPMAGLLRLQGAADEPRFARAVREVVGLPLPGPGRCAEANDLRLVWIAPREWMLCCALAREDELLRALESALGDLLSLITPASDSRFCLEVGGPCAGAFLGKLVAMDIGERRFAPGAATTTRIAGLAATLVHEPARTYALYFDVPHAAFVAARVMDAAAEFAEGPLLSAPMHATSNRKADR